VLDKDGWLATGRRVPSPNYDERPTNTNVSLLVIHNISLPPGSFGGSYVEDFFCNRLDESKHDYFTEISGSKVSAHLFIDRKGQITQFVAFIKRAWHCGISSFAGCDNCNDYSIGIELEGTDDTSYTGAQYLALTLVTKQLMAMYPEIIPTRIVGHSDIAPGRKTDPGKAFDWQRFYASVN
jgi:AmpD protein